MSWLRRLIGSAEPAPPASPSPDAVAAEMARAHDLAAGGDYEAALGLWGPHARAGHARAQNNVGACFAEGLGVARDAALARRWLTLAAEAGDPVGQRNLATLHFKGEGIEADAPRALALYRQAAEQGDAPAQDMLSWMLLEGEQGPGEKSASGPAEARLWAERAAAQGVAASMTRMGMLHHNALGLPRDPAEAARWWRLGAERDDADGQAMLGAALVLGSGVGRDAESGLAWLLRAMAGGSTLARPFLETARSGLPPEALARAEARAREPLPEPAPIGTVA